MNKIKLSVLLIIFVFLGYILGNFFPFQANKNLDEGIGGEAILEITIMTEKQQLLSGIEVNVAEKIGPPSLGGVVLTNDKGVAVFNIKPGSYYVFFNSSNFPTNLDYPEPRAINIEEEKLNKETIILFDKL
ncbi:MAG: hypothetical protein PHN37_02745 [Candidatus Pacebacteria bacterium]|nr:hypothetical protein [Candidatus Paceibacterota bacterium]